MKKMLPLFVIIPMLLLGVGMIFYPDISNWLFEQSQAGIVQNYQEATSNMRDEAIEKELEKAREYNDALTGTNIKDPFLQGSGAVLPPAGYRETLNINGAIGVIKLPKIDVQLVIYHGTGEDVLQKGVGHLEQTAFPIGGSNTHSVLTGHAALSSAKIFTDLEKIEIGDVFFITVLTEKLAYQVDQILVIEPHETEALRVIPDGDYVTLITCTPYGINSHRLLVRGTRIPYVEEMEQAVEVASKEIDWRLIIIVTFVGLFILGLLIYKYRERKKRKKKNLRYTLDQYTAEEGED